MICVVGISPHFFKKEKKIYSNGLSSGKTSDLPFLCASSFPSRSRTFISKHSRCAMITEEEKERER